MTSKNKTFLSTTSRVKSFASTADNYLKLRRAAYSETRRLLSSERSAQADNSKNKLSSVIQCVAKGLSNARKQKEMVHVVKVEVKEQVVKREEEKELKIQQEEAAAQKQSRELLKGLSLTHPLDDSESDDSDGHEAEHRSSMSKEERVQDMKCFLVKSQPSTSSPAQPPTVSEVSVKKFLPFFDQAPEPELTESHFTISTARHWKPEGAAPPPSSSEGESDDIPELPERLTQKHDDPEPESDSEYMPALRRVLVTSVDQDVPLRRPESRHLPRVARRTQNYGQGRKHRRPLRDPLAGRARQGVLTVQEEGHLRELLSELADGCVELSSSAAFGWPSEDLVSLLEICRAMVAELSRLCDEILQSNRPSTPRSVRAAEGQASELLRLCTKAVKQMAALRSASLSHKWKLSPSVQTAVAQLSSKTLQGSQALSHASTFGSFLSSEKVMTRGTAGSQFSSTASLLGWMRGVSDGSSRRPIQLEAFVQKEADPSLGSGQPVRQTGTSLHVTNETYDAEKVGAELHGTTVESSTATPPQNGNGQTTFVHAVTATGCSALSRCPQETTPSQANEAGILQTPAATMSALKTSRTPSKESSIETSLINDTPPSLSSGKTILLAAFSKGALLALEEESSSASRCAAKRLGEIKHVQQLLRRHRSSEEAYMATFAKKERCKPGEADPQLTIHGTIDNRCLLASRMRRTALAVTNLIAALVQLPEALATTAQPQAKADQAGVAAPILARDMLGSTAQPQMQAIQAGVVVSFSARGIRTKEPDLALELPIVAPFSARGIQTKDRNLALELPLVRDANQAVVQSTLPADSGHACSRSALPQLVTAISKPSAVMPNFRLRRRTPAKG